MTTETWIAVLSAIWAVASVAVVIIYLYEAEQNRKSGAALGKKIARVRKTFENMDARRQNRQYTENV